MTTPDTPGTQQASPQKLVRSTLIALGIAAVLLVTVVLPAEYGIDATGIGRVLGLTRMGEIKTRLAKEAASDAAADRAAAAAEDSAAASAPRDSTTLPP